MEKEVIRLEENRLPTSVLLKNEILQLNQKHEINKTLGKKWEFGPNILTEKVSSAISNKFIFSQKKRCV